MCSVYSLTTKHTRCTLPKHGSLEIENILFKDMCILCIPSNEILCKEMHVSLVKELCSMCSLSREMRSSQKRHTRPTGWRRPIGCFISRGHLSKKSHIISGAFAKRDLQLKASYAVSPERCALLKKDTRGLQGGEAP